MTKDAFESIPVPNLDDFNREPIIISTKLLLKLYATVECEKKEFLTGLQVMFSLEKISKKMDKYYELDFTGFINEMKKAKIKVPLKELQKLQEFFNDCKGKVLIAIAEIAKHENIINDQVYSLYHLNSEDIETISNCIFR